MIDVCACDILICILVVITSWHKIWQGLFSYLINPKQDYLDTRTWSQAWNMGVGMSWFRDVLLQQALASSLNFKMYQIYSLYLRLELNWRNLPKTHLRFHCVALDVITTTTNTVDSTNILFITPSCCSLTSTLHCTMILI